MKIELTKNYLLDAKYNRELTNDDISKESGWSTSYIKKNLKKYKITFTREMRSIRYKKMWKGRTWSPLTKFKKGHPQYNTGRTRFKKGMIPWNYRNADNSYPKDFSIKRDKIRKRDNFQCQRCYRSDKRLHVHHLDWDKQNNKDSNLITLCGTCHCFVHRKVFINNKLDWRTGFAAIVS
jgi:hypothetical protein